MSELAQMRWAAERERAASRGLVTVAQAAEMMGVSAAIVKRWKSLGLVTDKGPGGKGHPTLLDPTEVQAAPSRRVNVRARGGCTVEGCVESHWAAGKCGKHYRADLRATGRIAATPASTPAQNAETTLRKGRALMPMRSSPYRVLARTCPSCGVLMTTPDHLIRKKSGSLPRCHGCLIRTVRRNEQRRQAQTVEHATNNGNQWTGPEMELVLRGDLSVQQLALALGRTRNAVRYIQRQLIEKADPRYVSVAGVTEAMERSRVRRAERMGP